jgi:hypothetical protein
MQTLPKKIIILTNNHNLNLILTNNHNNSNNKHNKEHAKEPNLKSNKNSFLEKIPEPIIPAFLSMHAPL